MMRKIPWIVPLVFGVILAAGPLWGVIGTVFGMVLAFNKLSTGAPDVGGLANNIGFAMYSTIVGWVVCPIGIALIVLSVRRLTPKQDRAIEIPVE